MIDFQIKKRLLFHRRFLKYLLAFNTIINM